MDDSTATTVSARAKELFDAHIDGIRRRTDRLLAWLMAGQWVFGIVIAITYSPYAWAGRTRYVHPHLLAALLLGALLSSLPIGLAILRPGAVLTRNVIA